MKIKELIKRDPGFQYVIDNMEFMSGAGRRRMLETDFMTQADALEAEWKRLDVVDRTIRTRGSSRPYIDLRHCLMQLHDLQGTLATLSVHTP